MMMTAFRLILLSGLVICAIATALVKKPLQAVIIYMAYSVIMSIIWILLESPDLAITEAAVGAGITSILFFLTLRRIDLVDKDDARRERRLRREDEDDDEDHDAGSGGDNKNDKNDDGSDRGSEVSGDE